jgi:ABC-2 type transport system permease protein
MKNLTIAIYTEYMKVRKSKILWITFVFFAFVPCMMGLMIFVVRHPELTDKFGLIAAKASLFGDADWNGFFDIVNQMLATVGFIGFGFVSAWVFGREYMEKTLKDILALPISRTSIVLAKYIVIFVWCLILAIILFVISFIVGKIIGLDNWSTSILLEAFTRFFFIAFLTFIVSSPVAYFASMGKGIVAPIGFVILCLIIAQFVAIAGLGAFFPWSIPGLLSVPPNTDGMQLYWASYVIVAITGILGYLMTIYYWKRADQH